MARRVTLYTKADCHLCHDTREHLALLEATEGIVVVEVDITTDAELFGRFRYRIPVVDIGDGVLLEAPISLAQLREALR